MSASDDSAMTPVLRPYLPATAEFRRPARIRRAISSSAASPRSMPGSRGSAPSSRSTSRRRAPTPTASSARWRGGKPLSPIDGMPLGIKDIIETADMPTENGSPLFAGFRSERDAASVAALREAGGVILGKTVTTEFAATEPRGTRNPWDPARTPGGSSSGSAAAVGAGVIPVGLGTQVIGSILRPASFCGCFGFKPTIGAINRGGSYDGLSQSAHGTLAASLEEAWQVAYEIVEARRRRSRLSRPLRPAASAGADQAAPTRASRNRRLGGGVARCAAGRRGSAVPPDAGRRRHRDALRSCRDRGGGNRGP